MIDRIAFVLCCSLILFFLLRAAYFAGVQSAERKRREAQDLLETDFTLNTRGLPVTAGQLPN